MPKEGLLTLYLTDWQIRMLRDYVKLPFRPRVFTQMQVKYDPDYWLHIRTYRVPIFDAVKAGEFNLYLTTEQIRQVAEVGGLKAKFSALAISPAMFEKNIVCLK